MKIRKEAVMKFKNLLKKLNIDLAVSTRDKKLLMLVFSILLVVVSYYLVFSKVEIENGDKELEIIQLEKQVKDLNEKNRNKDKYIAEAKSYEEEAATIISNYAYGSSKPYILNFLNTVEDTTGVWLRSATFSQSSNVYTFGRMTPSNPTGTTTYTTDMTGLSNSLTLAYEGTYDEWKSFIAYVNNYFSKNTINSISSSYDSSADVVSGTVVINMYYITSSDREFKDESLDINTGKTNIFNAN